MLSNFNLPFVRKNYHLSLKKLSSLFENELAQRETQTSDGIGKNWKNILSMLFHCCKSFLFSLLLNHHILLQCAVSDSMNMGNLHAWHIFITYFSIICNL